MRFQNLERRGTRQDSLPSDGDGNSIASFVPCRNVTQRAPWPRVKFVGQAASMGPNAKKGWRRVGPPGVPGAVLPAAARETKPPGAAAVNRGEPGVRRRVLRWAYIHITLCRDSHAAENDRGRIGTYAAAVPVAPCGPPGPRCLGSSARSAVAGELESLLSLVGPGSARSPYALVSQAVFLAQAGIGPSRLAS